MGMNKASSTLYERFFSATYPAVQKYRTVAQVSPTASWSVRGRSFGGAHQGVLLQVILCSRRADNQEKKKMNKLYIECSISRFPTENHCCKCFFCSRSTTALDYHDGNFHVTDFVVAGSSTGQSICRITQLTPYLKHDHETHSLLLLLFLFSSRSL